ncbi:MAG: hypothetical protein ACD_54C00108G0003 [uncultured bacterium]|nr:MAG: hypothetical protein ACD_54C00108G0003 [uncultured bacterium]
MNELSALRRIALSSGPCCARIHHWADGTDTGIADVLRSTGALTSIIAFAHRMTFAQVASLAAPLITSDEPAAEPTPSDLEHVRFMHKHG